MSERRTRVQGEGCWYLPADHPSRKPTDKPPGTITWDEHVKAWEKYAEIYGKDQSAEQMVERGGFGYHELTSFLGHEPKTWIGKEETVPMKQ